ncbi:uncharacterized protein BDR25DRAFT_368188 [Lindgomyces ingoldianus]|uniref:Uncharacterized protein n=1 Tax=Lindgomyces ingoldianus TaxID=673940 RepID=A0ACB6QX34_9PLEO|nr:uncharacterized protein BDR25DRAFT_368188 [Lindgomyces ingoldianus]KAF2471362.1 hypothetical protein BDR25DRAFT_368188 [Lindgomyces ingoldianus]
MSLRVQVAALVGTLVTTITAHGHVSGIVADGTYYQGYDPSFQYQATPPKVVGWSCPQCLDNGFVSPDMYTTSNIACHKNATAGQASAKVAAGGTVELQWTAWPESHHGPVLDYLAKCDGDCTTATADGLSFFKIDQSGLLDDTTVPGSWASDKLISNNNSWTVTIPSSIATGNYVLRHEIIALHSAGQDNGAQNYPQCINIEVTGGGSASPSAEAATKFYTPTDPGILVNIYQSLTYEIPGPALFSGAESAPAQTSKATATGATPSAPVSTSALAVSSATPVASSAVTSKAALVQVTSTIAVTVEAPTTTEAPAGGNTTGPLPSKPLPEGITLKDLLEWLQYFMRNFMRHNNRKHPRHF